MKFATERLHAEKAEVLKTRLDKYGPAPINVFTRLRLTAGPNNSPLSHDALSRKIHVSKQALIRLEQGTFNVPLPSVVDFYVARGESELRMRDAYEDYQNRMRERHEYLFGDHLEIDLNVDDHPFRQLRYGSNPPLNPTEVSKSLCIPQATIEHFEKKWRTQKSVPKALVDCLKQIGYTWEQVESFRVAYTIWRVRQLGENVRSVRFS